MICPKCGNENRDNSTFCRSCGTKLSTEIQNFDKAVAQTHAPSVSNRRKSLLIVLSVIAVLLIFLGVIIIVGSKSSFNKFQEQLDLGNRYLSEMNYEQAIAAFEAAIEIDPKNVEAYKGLIEAYLGQGNPDGIRNAYEMASANLDKDSLSVIRDEASSGMMIIISDTLEKGDKDASRQMAYLLASIDSKSAERAILMVADYDEEESIEISDQAMDNEGINLLSEGHFDEAISYFENAIISDPSNTSLYCACAAAYLANNDSIGALEVLEKGRDSGADVDVINAKEEYIRNNTTIVSSYGNLKEWIPYDSYQMTGWSEEIFDDNGNSVSYEYHCDGDYSDYKEYDDNGKMTYYSHEYSDGYQRTWYTYNEHGDPIYEKYQSNYSNYGNSGYETYYTYEYDANGRKTSCIKNSDNYVETTFYEYDADGNMIHSAMIYQNNYSDIYEMFYTYDSYGRVVSYESSGSMQPDSGYYEYDERGNIIRQGGDMSSSSNVYDLMNCVISSSGSRGVSEYEATYTNTYNFHGDIYSVIN